MANISGTVQGFHAFNDMNGSALQISILSDQMQYTTYLRNGPAAVFEYLFEVGSEVTLIGPVSLRQVPHTSDVDVCEIDVRLHGEMRRLTVGYSNQYATVDIPMNYDG